MACFQDLPHDIRQKIADIGGIDVARILQIPPRKLLLVPYHDIRLQFPRSHYQYDFIQFIWSGEECTTHYVLCVDRDNNRMVIINKTCPESGQHHKRYYYLP